MSNLSLEQTDKTPNKITLDELIARKLEIKEKKNEKRELFIKSLDGTILIQKPDSSVCTDSIEMEDSREGDKYLIYNSVISPNLKDIKLHEVYGVTDNPLDIVDEIFDIGEVNQVAKEIVDFAGYGDSVRVVEKIKN